MVSWDPGIRCQPGTRALKRAGNLPCHHARKFLGTQGMLLHKKKVGLVNRHGGGFVVCALGSVLRVIQKCVILFPGLSVSNFNFHLSSFRPHIFSGFLIPLKLLHCFHVHDD